MAKNTKAVNEQQIIVPELPASMGHLAPYFTDDDKIAYSRLPAALQKELEQLKPAQWTDYWQMIAKNHPLLYMDLDGWRFKPCPTVVFWFVEQLKNKNIEFVYQFDKLSSLMDMYRTLIGATSEMMDIELLKKIMYSSLLNSVDKQLIPQSVSREHIRELREKAEEIENFCSRPFATHFIYYFINIVSTLIEYRFDDDPLNDSASFKSLTSWTLCLQPVMPDGISAELRHICRRDYLPERLLAVEIVAVFHHVYRNLGNSINLNWWRAIYRVLHERGYTIAGSPEAFINYMVKYKKEMQLMAEYFELADKSLMSPDKWVLNDKGSPAVDKSPFKASGNGSCPYYQLTPWKQWQTDYNERKPATRSNSAAKASLVKDFGDDDKLLDSMLCVAENLDKILHFFYPEEEDDMKPD